ncbi:MAG: Fis family transcriptional regulator [Rubrivivax sp.]|nr:Fis family transcriptional regulator [Rubrivivax sp.]
MNESPLQACVRSAVETYFRDLDGATPHGMHQMVLDAVEKPLLAQVLARAEGNQSRAAEWLGLNRNTLRRKLLQHGLTE